VLDRSAARASSRAQIILSYIGQRHENTGVGIVLDVQDPGTGQHGQRGTWLRLARAGTHGRRQASHGVCTFVATSGTGGLVGFRAIGDFALKVDIETIGGEYGMPTGFSLSPGIARQRASRTLPV
jgi:hypothetical protein